MSDLSYDHATRWLKADFYGDPYTRATTASLALYSGGSPPSKDGTGGTELSGSGYSRTTVNMNAATWDVTGTTAENIVAITTATASATWLQATHYALWSGATLLFVGALNTPVTVTSGSPLVIAAGDITPSVSGNISNAYGEDWLDHIFTGAAIDRPETVKIQATKTASTAATAGEPITGSAYAPLVVTCSNSFWVVTTESEGVEVANGIDFEFLQAESDWDTPVGWDMTDNVTGLRLYWATHAGRPIATGDHARYRAAGDSPAGLRIRLT